VSIAQPPLSTRGKLTSARSNPSSGEDNRGSCSAGIAAPGTVGCFLFPTFSALRPDPRMRPARYAWLVVVLLWVVALLNYVDRQVIFSVFPLLKADLQFSDVQLGLLSTIFLWIYGVLSPVAGFLGDRFGRKPVIVASISMWTIVTWATGHARNFEQLILTRALMGLAEACYLPAGLALIADYHGKNTRSLATGLHQSGLYAGVAVGGAAGGRRSGVLVSGDCGTS